ncbi:MAG: RNA polymerase sigma factor [Candidatus Brocadiia bacterium]
MDKTIGSRTDQALVVLFQNDDGQRRRAFCELYERHAGALRNYLLRLTGAVQTAEDLTQETFLRALEGLESFTGRSSFKTWLFTIGTNLVRDHFRRKKPMGSLADDLTSSHPDPAEKAETDDDVRRLRSAVADLPESQRFPLVLVRFEGMKYREAAEALGITLAAVRMRIHRAHLALTEALTDPGGEL